VNPIVLRRQDLALQLVAVLNRLGRQVGRIPKAHIISRYGRRTVFEVHFPDVERGEVTAILRLLLSGYRIDAITPIMVTRERETPRFGARAV
jgi:hypothetical protein